MSISPNVPTPEESFRYEAAAAGTPRWIIAVFVALIAAVAALGYFGYSTQSHFEQTLAAQQTQNKMVSSQLDQANSRLAELKSHMELTERKLGVTQAELAQARSRAESIRKEQIESDQKLSAQLGQVKQESEEKIGAVSTELGGAKKDIETTKNDLEATKSKLESAKGDMGVMSGLIARNHDDVEELKRRGERNYYEFTLVKSKSPQRVGPIQVSLSKTDPKKSKFTITVIADDRNIEKRDRTTGEPVQFYVGHARVGLYEIVVYDLGKNQATGYLSTPKDLSAAAAPAAPSAASKP